MALSRYIRHLTTMPWRVRSAFPRASLESIERAIHHSRTQHVGEIRFVVEGALHGPRLYHGQSSRERAIEVFSLLRMWDTEHRNGVLIYLLLADRAVEIIADRGAHVKIGAPEWERICRAMEVSFKAGRYEQGALTGIERVTQCLARHFPGGAAAAAANGDSGDGELPDSPVVLP